MCEATTLAYAAMAIATAGGGAYAADQQRKASHQAADAANAAGATPAAAASAYTSPEADPNAPAPITRRGLKVNINSSLVPKSGPTGAGLQVGGGSGPAPAFGNNLVYTGGVRG